MGSWYIVRKRINNRLYLYWQRTKRVGKSVKTENRYIGPASGPALTPSTYSSTAPTSPEGVIEQYFTPHASEERQRGNIRKLTAEKKTIMRNEEYFDADAFDHVQNELDYAHAVKRHREKIRAVKRKTKGIQAFNPFLAQAIREKD